jgi:opacity protein-like surface antigen
MPGFTPLPAVLAVLIALGGSASAQDTVTAGDASTSAVKVVKDRATIWTRNPSQVLALAPAGTVLRAIARDAKWYEVEVPESLAARPGGAVGFILGAHVELLPGVPAPPARATRPDESQWAPVGPGSGAESVAATKPALPAPAFGIRGFGSFNYMFFAAQDSFEAVFGASSYPMYGGGAEVIFGGRFFVSGSFEHFQRTGQRVFVSDGEVFELGIDDKVTIQPITFTAGYRLRSSDRFVPYLGGGAGIYRFKEESEFADPGEDIDDTFTSYHALAGVEYAASKWLFAGFEVQYTGVPDSLGVSGVSAEFDEKNLGGLSLRVKLSVGR